MAKKICHAVFLTDKISNFVLNRVIFSKSSTTKYLTPS